MTRQKIKIAVNDPANFSFQECLHFLGRSDKECLHYITDGKLRRMVLADGEPVVIEVAPGTRPDHLLATVLAPVNNIFQEDDIRLFVTRWLHLDADLQPFYDYTLTDPLLNGLATDYRGLRLVGMPDLFEAISWPIIGQQINLSFAYTLRQRFIQAFGFHQSVDGTDYYLYPHPAVIAALSPADLAPMQFSRSKALYLVETAKVMASGELSAQLLAPLSYEEARDRLVALKGIGNWSANYVLMKYSRFPQALLLEDVGLQNAIRHRLGLPAKPSMAELQQYTRSWQQHAAYATFYLWRSLLSPI
ncbi:DNA-3-methyladenine glycosylase family protein [Chitinophaga flava]|uniref:DNA-3-methyladenine glycosylase II n=1 Tax=Chitinophaga flava TaxID=2259036 RepID=A0A365XTF4_9BACT|nr:DNA-3-methyladenine glycosylase [Chitinophaga flava]RBL89398.1 DNA-3-methyladenine glycosylase [Chitinophaga flava]